MARQNRLIRTLAAAALITLVGATPAQVRPLTVDDALARETIGRVSLSPDWLFAEIRGPYAAAGRFDDDLTTELLRTTLKGTPLGSPSSLRPLFPHETGVGYALGSTSPQGDQTVVFRLKAGRWELGVASPSTGAVRWLGVTPFRSATGRSVAWTGPRTVLVLALANSDSPMDFKLRGYPLALTERRATTAAGGVAATVVGSGRHLGLAPRAPDRRLLVVDLDQPIPRVLATGAFTDFEPSPDGRRVALLVEDGAIPLIAGQPVQGAWGIETRRSRLALLDARTGSIDAPCPAFDILGQLLRWSPTSEDLLIFARRDGEPWTDGRLLRVSAADAVARAIGSDLRPLVSRRPAVVHAGWMGRDPIVFARPVGAVDAGRADWFRLVGARAVNLTQSLPPPAADPTILSGGALWLVSGRRLWRMDRHGAAASGPLFEAPPRLFDPPGQGLRPRAEISPLDRPDIPVVIRRDKTDTLELDRGRTPLLLPPHSQVIAAGPAGALVRTRPADEPEALAWLQPGAAPRLVATLNPGVAEIDAPRVVPVPHRGPKGEPLISWLMLPAGPRAQPPPQPPPLVVWPYPGSAYPTFPAYLDALGGGGIETPALLVGQGYAVLIPSLPKPLGGQGPAADLAARVMAIIDAAAARPDLRGAFDPERLGIWGASFGGYGTLAILTQTDRFAAAIVQGAPADLFSMHGDFGLKRLAIPEGGPGSNPSAGWTEDLQGDMGGPPWIDPDRYVRNSPVFAADRIHTPLLIFHGDLDTIPVGQAQEMFSALHRQNKDVVLVTYWGEGHRFVSPGTLRDYYRRAFAWLDDHLRSPAENHPGTPKPDPARDPASDAPRPPPSPRP